MQKFKCISCGELFEADETSQVVCPKCHSDNVTPVVKSKLNNNVALGVILLVAVGCGSLGGRFITKWWKGTDMPKEELVAESEVIEQEDSIAPIGGVESNLPLTLEIVNQPLRYDNKSNTYQLTVAVGNVKDGTKVSYELWKSDDFSNPKNMVAKSEDGQFTNIQPSNNPVHSYWVVAKVMKDGMVTEKNKEITGFRKVEHIDMKVTKEQLQQMINRQDAALQGDNAKFANQVKFTVKGDDYRPDTFQDVFTQVMLGIWTSVTVTSIGYDANNRVNAVGLTVKKQ